MKQKFLWIKEMLLSFKIFRRFGVLFVRPIPTPNYIIHNDYSVSVYFDGKELATANFNYMGDSVELHTFVVYDKEWREYGIGRKMLNVLVEEAKTHGCNTMYVSVGGSELPQETLYKIYSKLGFVNVPDQGVDRWKLDLTYERGLQL